MVCTNDILKSCPFCGKHVKITKGLVNAPFYYFKCSNSECGAIMSFNNRTVNSNPPKAVDYFNRRKG